MTDNQPPKIEQQSAFEAESPETMPNLLEGEKSSKLTAAEMIHLVVLFANEEEEGLVSEEEGEIVNNLTEQELIIRERSLKKKLIRENAVKEARMRERERISTELEAKIQARLDQKKAEIEAGKNPLIVKPGTTLATYEKDLEALRKIQHQSEERFLIEDDQEAVGEITDEFEHDDRYTLPKEVIDVLQLQTGSLIKDHFDEKEMTLGDKVRRDGKTYIINFGVANAFTPTAIIAAGMIIGPEAAAFLTAAEAATLAIPVIPGGAGVFRFMAYTLGEGTMVGYRNYKKALHQGQNPSFRRKWAQSVAIGLPVAMDFGYAFIPVTNMLRRINIDFSPQILMRGYKLRRLCKKYGVDINLPTDAIPQRVVEAYIKENTPKKASEIDSVQYNHSLIDSNQNPWERIV